MKITGIGKFMINIQNLKVSFGDNLVLNDISLDISEGETLVVMGKNGAGKSVLLKTIAGLIDNYVGVIEIKGVDILSFSELDKKSLSYVFQKGGLFDSMNVFDNVAFGLKIQNIEENEVEKRVNDAITRVGLKDAKYKLPSELSGGMQKRVGLARAICLDNQIILYDDPTAGLDPILCDSIADLILEIREALKTTSVVVTHELSVVKKIADKVALLYNGEIVFYGNKENFFSKKDLYSKQFIDGDFEGPIDMF